MIGKAISGASDRIFTLSKQISVNFSSNSSSKEAVVLFNREQNFVKVTLNKPKALNALNYEMIQILRPQVKEWNQSGVKAVYFTGAGGKAFCAGGDIRSLYDAKKAGGESAKLLDIFFRDEYKLDLELAEMIPTQISVFDGFVMGGGVGISVNSPIKIATENAVFSMPEGKIGLFTDVGGGFFLSRMRKNIGRYLGLTGARLQGQELVEAGFANFYVPRDQLQALEADLKAAVNSSPNISTNELQAVVQKHADKVSESLKNQDTINSFFSGESLNEIVRQLSTATEQQEFAEQTLKIIREQNAISARIIFEQIQRGASLNLKQNLAMDFRLITRFCQNEDFFEGVRCMLIDRNDQPKWSYKTLQEVPDDLVKFYFEELPKSKEWDP